MVWIRWGSLMMALAIILGAFGAHGLKGRLSAEMMQVYQTAVLYHLVHGLGLLIVGWLSVMRPMEPMTRSAAIAFIIGIILFSGSLYALSLTGVKKLGMITPFGGLSFIVGWIFLYLSAKT